jgi:FtsZ-binding cell division protein ZapB
MTFARLHPDNRSTSNPHCTMPEMSQKTWLVVVATLALTVAYLGYQLSSRNSTIGLLNSDNAELALEKDQLVLDLEKMRFSYDTLETENTMMLAELAAQQERIDGLLTKVKNGYWEVAKLKKEAETLRSIMKGYIGTIDSLNQLNLALLGENLAMKEQMEAVSQENADLVERQENMEEMLEAGQTLQVSELNPVGVRVLSSGRQRDTDRADRSDMLRVCFTILENRIAPVGSKTLHLRITDSDGNLLPSEDEATDYSASRTLDYARERLDACIFYASSDDSMEGAFRSGTYLVEVLEGETVIGTTDLILR